MFGLPVKFKIPRNNDIVNNNYKKELSNSPRWINNLGRALIDSRKIEENNNTTYCKINYKKHNNFAMEKIEIPNNIKKTENKFNTENKINTENKNIKLNNLRNKYKKILEDRKINKNKTDIKTAGDGKDINSKNNWYYYMEKVELQIGGTSIDKKMGVWLDIWEDLKSGRYDDYDDIINNKILIDNTVDEINDNIIEYIQLDKLDIIYNYNNDDTNILEI